MSISRSSQLLGVQPLEKELFFYDVWKQMNHVHSSRQSYRLFCSYLTRIGSSYFAYQEQILRLSSHLTRMSHPLSWYGISADELQEFISSLDALNFQLPKDLCKKHIHPHTTRLRQILLLTHCCLNEAEEADSLLRDLFFDSCSRLNLSLRTQNPIHLSTLEALLRSVNPDTLSSDAEHSSYTQLLNDLSQIRQIEGTHVFLPVTEKQNSGILAGTNSGRLRILYADLLSDAPDCDTLIFNTPMKKKESSAVMKSNSEGFLRAVRSLAEEFYPGLKGRYSKGMAYFEFNSITHHGNSHNLALAALWLSCLSGNSGPGSSLSLSPSIAITGGLDASGSVLPVEPGSVQPKTEAAFFSCCTGLVVPASQLHLFREAVQNLKERHPHKSFTLIGVSELRELALHRKIMRKVLQPDGSILSKLKGFFKTV